MLNELLEMLLNKKSSNEVFNPYQNEYMLNNLRLYFEYLLENNSRILLVGEAPGYRGCRLTGIPFTSETIIRYSQHEIFKKLRDKINLIHEESESVSENTATILWSFLIEYNKPAPILWNAFPFHPHEKGVDESNRKPREKEIEEGLKYLKMVYEIFKPQKIAAIGRVGEAVLSQLFPFQEIIYIRHPSYGGKKDFIKGMLKLYDTNI
ncbi:conserved hypothetical protein [Thermotomaculum hydrothermale]|uniref:Uracil-DNA glycosylase-like domain-containing protein n=1 Tax=Thermotomaculum hydrothermale TaxID=981385 RepID=A0A7R6PS56_9BACT|nr:uracil-DNA glycosylase [Thermotomaculum hydrothermale]BBB33356.1 conserved hypothetical protein [Thermotomaculum hydrothermale]